MDEERGGAIVKQFDVSDISAEKSLNESGAAYTQSEHKSERVKKKKESFNGLSAKQWAALSKNVWNDVSSPRDQHQLEHGATFPVKLAERLISMYSRAGDVVFDPFAGIGTTVIAAQNLHRHALGMELNPRFAEIAENWIQENQGLFTKKLKYMIINDDCRCMLRYFKRAGSVQVTVTSPPYANFIRRSIEDRTTTHKTSVIKLENNSTVNPYSDDPRDFGNLPYDEFLQEIRVVLQANFEVTSDGGYSAWIVKDYRDTKNGVPYVPFHVDLARVGENVGFKWHDLIVWDQTGQRRLVLLGYPSVFYTNQNCSFIIVFRKPK